MRLDGTEIEAVAARWEESDPKRELFSVLVVFEAIFSFFITSQKFVKSAKVTTRSVRDNGILARFYEPGNDTRTAAECEMKCDIYEMIRERKLCKEKIIFSRIHD